MDTDADFKDGKLLRIFVEERERGAQPLYAAIAEFLRKRGATRVGVARSGDERLRSTAG
jgi:PII-like signaling protein